MIAFCALWGCLDYYYNETANVYFPAMLADL